MNEGTCGPQTRVGQVSTTPRTAQPRLLLGEGGEEEVRFGCKIGTFRPF